jgi:hypothetical protein
MEITPALLVSLNVTRRQFDARMATIVSLVQRSDDAVKVACVRLYARQTADEKQADMTRHDNEWGFQYMDAKFGGKMARVILAGEQPFDHNMPRLRRMAVKYRRQLTVMAFLKDRERLAA